MQLTSFGHPDTTGIPNVDYFLSSELYETARAPDHYSEKLVTLPGMGTLAWYHRPAAPVSPLSRGAIGLADDDHLYLCPQTLFKLHPDMDRLFLGIVERDPKARIVLIEPADRAMREQVEARMAALSGALADRLVFVRRLPHADYLRLIAAADVQLDTVHFNGQNTSLEGFALGVPIVTLPGELQRSRHTLGMYLAMGYTDLVAEDEDDYVRKAVAVACDPVLRSACSDRIRAAAPVLYENRAFVEGCEAAFSKMIADTVRARSESK